MRAGEPVVLVADNRPDLAYLVFAAELATSATVSFGVRYTSGYLRAAVTPERFTVLDLPLLVNSGPDSLSRFYTVAVDAVSGVTTGISAKDRAMTIRMLADEGAAPEDFTRPGHVIPVCAMPGGLLRRPGFTEAAVDLAAMAGLTPAAALGELVTDAGTLMCGNALGEFCKAHHLAQVSVSELIAYRRGTDFTLVPLWRRSVRLAGGRCLQLVFGGKFRPVRHDAFVFGELAAVDESTPLMVHRECVAGDVVLASDCNCRAHLDQALAELGQSGQGILVLIGANRYMSEFTEENFLVDRDSPRAFWRPADAALLREQDIYDMHQRQPRCADSVATDIQRYLVSEAALLRENSATETLGLAAAHRPRLPNACQ
ncbi:hypothetical protein B1R94_28760 [Mycolicibacterium litorale]|nr:hypothetical protein B1R94_28760 [Mycolicibacterium litorale]